MDSDNDDTITEIKPKIEDILLLSETYASEQKEKKHHYGKKRYKNVKVGANVKITDEDMEKMIVDDLSGQYFPGYVKYFKSHYKDSMDKSMKNSKKSIEARIKGNELFSKAHSVEIHKDLWELYSKSVAFAPVKSKELVLAFECRSNLLLHLKKYADCIKDIDRALAITKFQPSVIKFLCRKMTCYVAMHKSIADKAELWMTLNSHLDKLDKVFKDDKFLKMVEQAKTDVNRTESNKGKECTCCKKPLACHSDRVDMVFHKEIRVVANRDFAPGDMVVVTKPLVTSFNPNKFYAYCSHCSSFMWAGIPCDGCSLCMYCSEECKTEAWNKYHILECKLLPHINFEDISYNKMHLSIRVFLKGIKEFGSVSKLKEKMQEIDKFRDECKLRRNLLDNEFLQFYASLYVHIISSPDTIYDVTKLAMKSCFLVVCIIQTCNIFKGKNFNSLRGKEFAKEQDIVNFGFVILKILILNTKNIKVVGPTYTLDDVCSKYSNATECSTKRHCIRGSYYDMFNAMFEKSCNPNVVRCYTDEGKIIYYCVQPIKKMEKITICQNYEFFSTKIATRDKYAYFSIHCQCVACLKDWSTMEKLFEKTKQRRLKMESKESKIVQKYLERNKSETKFIHEDSCLFNNEEYEQLLRDVNEVVKACGQPSFASSFMIYYLCVTFELGYGINPLSFHVAAQC